jgi:hypothetical protein
VRWSRRARSTGRASGTPAGCWGSGEGLEGSWSGSEETVTLMLGSDYGAGVPYYYGFRYTLQPRELFTPGSEKSNLCLRTTLLQ